MSSADEQKINEKRIKILKQGIIIFVLCIVIVFLVMVIFHILHGESFEFMDSAGKAIVDTVVGEDGDTATLSEAAIRKVFEISELSTADYTYNAIARAYAEDGVDIKYFVAYEGRVKVGIDFSKVEIAVDEEEKRITITVPEIQFQEKTVDPGTLEFIFKDKKSETEYVHQEAYLLCQKDLDEKTKVEKELLELASANAKSVVEALVIPWIKQIEDDYTIDIRMKEESIK